MTIFLYMALGALLLVVVVLVALGVGYWWLKRKWNEITALAKQDGQTLPPAMRIALEEVAEPEWSQPEQVKRLGKNLEALGYQPIGSFELSPIRWGTVLRGVEPKTLVGAYHHAETGAFASFYDMEIIDLTIVDLIAYFEDGKNATSTTAPDGGMDSPNWTTTERFPELDVTSAEDVKSLHEKLAALIGERTVKRKPASEFAQIFRKAWAREMDWRMSRGGTTPDEIRQIAANAGNEEPDEDTIAFLREPWLEQISWFVSDQVKKRYLKKTQMSGDEWSKTEDRLLVVHEMSTAGGLIATLAEDLVSSGGTDEGGNEDEDEDLFEQIFADVQKHFEQHEHVPTAFKESQAMLPKNMQYKRLGSFSKPFKGDIWLEPERDEEVGPDLSLDLPNDDEFQ